MADYAKMKNAELEALLKERNLPHTGKKAELVKRLQDADAEGAAAAPKKDEDEIDWDDEPATATATTAVTTEPPKEEIKEAPSEPVAAPSTDTTSATSAPSAPAAEPAPAPAKDFSAGLAPTALDDEIAKRRARAAKFGTDPEGDETLKALERAKRFGEKDVAGKLDSALPEKRERNKRGREGEEAGGERKRRLPQQQNGQRGPRERGGQGEKRTPAAAPRGEKKDGAGAPGWMNDADRAKMEARKAKFATNAAA
ncbi:hypothetical protein ANO11243_041310 [Dothideomycetidae sp. 11243]|nr:hypothetical protein ANO11243_041310 [fungal sp. No.11243]